MTGRGIDQVLPHPSSPRLFEPYVQSALDYVLLAERMNGPIPRPVDYAYVWGLALDVLAEVRPQARIINLEVALTTSDAAAPKGINYRMHPDNAAVLAAAEVDCCALANNHILDWGELGLHHTLNNLAHAGIRAAGAGPNIQMAQAPAIVDSRSGGRVLVFAFGTTDSGIPTSWAADTNKPGVHLLRDFSDEMVDALAGVVTSAKRELDIAVATIHWGGNWGYEISPEHRRFAHALIDRAGLDIVHGHSSHHPKAIEVYRDRPILYGCGDFVDDYEGISGHEPFRNDLKLMYFPTLDARDGRLVRLEMTPLHMRNFRLHRPSRADRAWLGELLDRECARFGHHVSSRDDSFALDWG